MKRVPLCYITGQAEFSEWPLVLEESKVRIKSLGMILDK